MSIDPRFEEPPVREVGLTIFFDRVPTLQSINLAKLRVSWANDYPKVSEVPPRPPLRGERAFAEYLSSDSFWPMPFIAFTSTRGDRAIQIQSDRFGIAWRFDHAPKMYPGYEELSRELLTRFAEFREAIASELEQDLEPTDIDVEYTNLIDGYRPEDFAAGVLTNWANSQALCGPADLAGLRLHFCSNVGNSEIALTISINPTFDEQSDASSCVFELNATAKMSPSDEVEGTMRAAHGVLVDRFVELTNDSLRAGWGWNNERR
ncbi:TIGR04255 family protein [Micromonospora sp. NPDC049081]|uniref:TIGR04255 family protein n=1 Tax=Micromonospora sp. NPDC049081 TaxID=3155150 RepID=UPI003409FD04